MAFRSMSGVQNLLKILLAFTMCSRPSTRFNHHLRVILPTVAAQMATDMRDFTVKVIASVAGVDPSAFGSYDDARASLFQLLLPGSLGGCALPDPVAMPEPCFLASFAAALANLRTDALLGPHLAEWDRWHDSRSPTLRQVAQAWYKMADRPAFVAARPHRPTDREPPTVPQRMLDHTGECSLGCLHLIAPYQPQSVFSYSVFKQMVDTALLPSSNLTIIARARFRAAAQRGAAALFTAHHIPPRGLLTDIGVTWLITHRCGVVPPFYTHPPLHCHPRCKDWPPTNPIYPAHPLFPLVAYLLHQASCAVEGVALSRHDGVLRALVTAACLELGAKVEYVKRLYSSTDSRKKTDALVTNWRQLPPEHMLDCTIAGPMLPTYLAKASGSGHAIFIDRETEKNKKHGPGCVAANRLFTALVATTLGGLGASRFLEWFDSAFGASIALHVAAGGSGHEIADRKQAAILEAEAALNNATAHMVSSFSRDRSSSG